MCLEIAFNTSSNAGIYKTYFGKSSAIFVNHRKGSGDQDDDNDGGAREKSHLVIADAKILITQS